MLKPPGAQRTRAFLLGTQRLVSLFFVVDRRTGGEQLRCSLLDLRNRSAYHARLRLVISGALNHVFQTAGDWQQQRRVITQVLCTRRIKAFKVFDQATEQRQLLFDRDIFVQHLLKALHQPVEGSSPSAALVRVDLRPMVLTQMLQKSEARQQPLERLTLVQAPGEPGAYPQILGLGA